MSPHVPSRTRGTRDLHEAGEGLRPAITAEWKVTSLGNVLKDVGGHSAAKMGQPEQPTINRDLRTSNLTKTMVIVLVLVSRLVTSLPLWITREILSLPHSRELLLVLPSLLP